MPCPHFQIGTLCRCTAVRGLLVPSLYERERFCRSDEPARCPTYRARSLREEALPEEVYYALWLPWADGGKSRIEEALGDSVGLASTVS
jgi:hypothetical protein